ncbi:conserved hypothetical protein [delta proteobacterium NaphS2]|nr:conserved hypothetical protein [delta proteobacterium NaphS2]
MRVIGVIGACFVLIFVPLGGSVWCDQGLPLAATKEVEEAVIGSIGYPQWISSIPEGCFVGISNPCQSIEPARKQALYSALSEILQAMGADYELKHETIISGNLHRSHHQLRERLSYSSQWFLWSVQQNILKSHVQQTPAGYVFYLLIEFPEDKIRKLRRLSMGPKLGAVVMKSDEEGMLIEVRENNCVAATLTGYRMKITTENRHADLITLFAWKVPKGTSREIEGVLDRKITLKGNSQVFLIRTPASGVSLKNLILGSETRIAIILTGYDEIGREFTFPVSAF